MVKVIGSIYNGNNTVGDFNWMIKQSIYKDCLFIFNDNIEYHLTNKKGGGNAIIRQFNRFSSLAKPMSAGIPTGTLAFGGFTKLDEEVKTIIDGSINEIKELIEKYNFDTVYFSQDSSGKLGTSIFKVNQDVIDYITDQIYKL
jgi:hypothetical protein